MTAIDVLIVGPALALALVFGVLFLRARTSLARLTSDFGAFKSRYASAIDSVDNLNKIIDETTRIRKEIEDLRISYRDKKTLYDNLLAQVAVFDERLSFAEVGLYEPHFNFTDSEVYKAEIQKVREAQKGMIRAKVAVAGPDTWTVDGSQAKGRTMINRQVRLSLRAFNNECEAAISNVTWNNVNAMLRRIEEAENAIHRENETLRVRISPEYVRLKIAELRLTHEYKEKQKQEKEERAELARAEREERRLQSEAEQAEKERLRYQKLVDQARREARVDLTRIADLESKLADAIARSERAQSMAELTKCGYVYVISNIGSFGEAVMKIGLTRRLDPEDRVRELGDASVPFGFDIHAMIYSDDAPNLETSLHKRFSDRRINLSNNRKEFFSVTIEEIEIAVAELAPNASFYKDREAQEWHETLARRNALLKSPASQQQAFPEEI